MSGGDPPPRLGMPLLVGASPPQQLPQVLREGVGEG